MLHIGSSLFAWLTADFEIFGLSGQNWMLAFSGGVTAIFLVLAVFMRSKNGHTGSLW
ncbi:MAG TPA: hypothetical protein VFS63_13450 [Pseudolabrys sp.]|nr:hypothetical protein [Pseudolabrys sp.]